MVDSIGQWAGKKGVLMIVQVEEGRSPWLVSPIPSSVLNLVYLNHFRMLLHDSSISKYFNRSLLRSTVYSFHPCRLCVFASWSHKRKNRETALSVRSRDIVVRKQTSIMLFSQRFSMGFGSYKRPMFVVLFPGLIEAPILAL